MLGVERTERILKESDAIILMEEVAHFYPDSREPLPRVAQTLKLSEESALPVLLIVNKTDTLENDRQRSRFTECARKLDITLCSLAEGSGTEAALEFLREMGMITDTSTRFLLTKRQRALVLSARQSLEQAAESLRGSLPLDVISVDLYDAQKALSQILTIESRDTVIEQVFSRFCVGK
jgi:tRNA modification GTPase